MKKAMVAALCILFMLCAGCAVWRAHVPLVGVSHVPLSGDGKMQGTALLVLDKSNSILWIPVKSSSFTGSAADITSDIERAFVSSTRNATEKLFTRVIETDDSDISDVVAHENAHVIIFVRLMKYEIKLDFFQTFFTSSVHSWASIGLKYIVKDKNMNILMSDAVFSTEHAAMDGGGQNLVVAIEQASAKALQSVLGQYCEMLWDSIQVRQAMLAK